MKKKTINIEEPKILCPYCRENWTFEMWEQLETSQGCDSCGYGAGISGKIEIICNNCDKVVYTKIVDID